MSDLYIEARLDVIKNIASASCSDIKDADNIASLCDEIYSEIEIIKQDGVSNNVCEWKKFKGNSSLFETSCGNISGMYRGFSFCPFCGKEIKITN